MVILLYAFDYFQELIQNADDACATEVEFLLDELEHSTEHLIHPDVHQYQGPALYAWNNALFQEEDWEGIRDISVSRKEKKVLKVGRFALGFISVYHITGKLNPLLLLPLLPF